MEVGPREQPGLVLEPSQYLLLSGPGIRSGLHDDRRSLAQVAGQRTAGCLEAGQVGQAIAQRRGHGDQGHVESRAGVGARRWPEPPGFERRRDLTPGHVLDVALPGFQLLHPRLKGRDGRVEPGRRGHRLRRARQLQLEGGNLRVIMQSHDVVRFRPTRIESILQQGPRTADGFLCGLADKNDRAVPFIPQLRKRAWYCARSTGIGC